MSSLSVSDSVTVERLYGEAEASDFLALLKPRVMSLVVFTAAVGLLLAPGSIGWVLGTVSILAIAVGAGASGALNMWYDSDIDAVMSRTRTRPIPSGRVGREEALIFGMVLSVLSVMVLGLAANWAAAGLLAFTIFFYAVVYTMWLKRTTPQNIVIGGAAGAFPPMVGWAAATGGVGLESVLLFLLIFLWTPPHFWALALFKENDYERAGIPMMPNVAGGASTRRQILAYSMALAVTCLLPVVFGFSGILYAVTATVLGGFFLYRAVQVWRNAGADPLLLAEKRLFGFSLIYLFAIFAALLVDRLAVSWLTAGWL